MKRLYGYVISALLATSAIGCATTGQAVSKSDEDEVGLAAKNETAPKPPSASQIEQTKQAQQSAAKAPEKPKISASSKAEFDGAVKKWEAAKKANTDKTDCLSFV